VTQFNYLKSTKREEQYVHLHVSIVVSIIIQYMKVEGFLKVLKVLDLSMVYTCDRKHNKGHRMDALIIFVIM